MEFITYRATRIAIAALIFIGAIFAVRAIRLIDLKTTGALQYIDRAASDLYGSRNARVSSSLRIVDLNLSLDDKNPNIKQACAQLIDTLFAYGTHAIVVDIFFDPHIDTTGRTELLRVAKRYPNLVFGFKFSKDADHTLARKLKRLGPHAVPYSQEQTEMVRKWPDRNLYGVELPLDGIAENAARMGFVDISPELDGRIKFYPLFQRLGGVDSVFAGLSTQACRLWIEKESGLQDHPEWSLTEYFDYFYATFGVEWQNDGRVRIRRISGPIRPNFTWQDFQNHDVEPRLFAGKMVVMVNSPTEEGGPLDESDYPMWGHHVSVISQFLDRQAGQGADLIFFPLLLALYSAWVYVRLWPAKINNRLVGRRYVVWLGMAAFLYVLPLALPRPNLTPVSAMLLLGIALFTFEAVEHKLLRIPAIKFTELPFVLDEPEPGAARLSIQQAPVRLGKRTVFDLPADQAKAWHGYQRPPNLSALPEMRKLGESLYEFIMAGEVGSIFEASLENAVNEGRILRLRIRSESANFDGLPLEMLRNSVKDYGYLALHNHLSIVRDLTADPSPELHWELPLRLLVLMASPIGGAYPSLNVQDEKRKILHGTRLLQRKGWLKLKVIDHVTHALLEGLPANSFDVIHFVGHGIIDPNTQSNCLVFEDQSGEPDEIDAEYFGQRARQIGPKLILLNACVTGEGTEKGVFINIARELQRTTGAVVIAQQYSISDYGGIVFSDAFYKTFAQTLSPELALNRARQIIAGTMNTLPSDWVSPVYFIR